MFTIKFYSDSGFRQVILEAESFTVLRDESGAAEVTMHRQPGPNGEYRDVRHDVGGEPTLEGPPMFERAIIENAAGKTTEIISARPRMSQPSALAA